jgi:hypothetical protein
LKAADMKWRLVVGLIAGWALWIVLAAVERVYSVSVVSVPQSVRVVADPVMTVVGLVAWPLALGGWFLWGENYLTITSNMPLNVVIGLTLWGGLGVLAAVLIHRRRPR